MPSIFDEEVVATNALDRANKIQKLAIKAGFKWSDVGGVLLKVEEELAEVKEAMNEGCTDHLRSEIGDLLFSVAVLAIYADIHPENALDACNKKFVNRFKYMENYMDKHYEGEFKSHKVEEMIKGWQAAKVFYK